MNSKQETLELMEQLAMLRYLPEEQEQTLRQVVEITNLARTLGGVRTGDLPPLTHLNSRSNVFREDVVRQECARETLLQLAPESDEGYYVAPPVFD